MAIQEGLDGLHVGRLGRGDVLEDPAAPGLAQRHVDVVGQLLLLAHPAQAVDLLGCQGGDGQRRDARRHVVARTGSPLLDVAGPRPSPVRRPRRRRHCRRRRRCPPPRCRPAVAAPFPRRPAPGRPGSRAGPVRRHRSPLRTRRRPGRGPCRDRRRPGRPCAGCPGGVWIETVSERTWDEHPFGWRGVRSVTEPTTPTKLTASGWSGDGRSVEGAGTSRGSRPETGERTRLGHQADARQHLRTSTVGPRIAGLRRPGAAAVLRPHGGDTGGRPFALDWGPIHRPTGSALASGPVTTGGRWAEGPMQAAQRATTPRRLLRVARGA